MPMLVRPVPRRCQDRHRCTHPHPRKGGQEARQGPKPPHIAPHEGKVDIISEHAETGGCDLGTKGSCQTTKTPGAGDARKGITGPTVSKSCSIFVFMRPLHPEVHTRICLAISCPSPIFGVLHPSGSSSSHCLPERQSTSTCGSTLCSAGYQMLMVVFAAVSVLTMPATSQLVLFASDTHALPPVLPPVARPTGPPPRNAPPLLPFSHCPCRVLGLFPSHKRANDADFTERSRHDAVRATSVYRSCCGLDKETAHARLLLLSSGLFCSSALLGSSMVLQRIFSRSTPS